MDSGKCRSLFLIDDTREYTNNYYIFELVKIVLFQEGAFSLSLPTLRIKIEEITDMNYTEDEILHAISEMNNNIIECNNNEYSLTEHGEQIMHNRQQNICIDSYVKAYIYEELSSADKPQVKDSIDLIYRFIFERFNENISQVASILNDDEIIDLPKEKYSNQENEFINGFLQWDNAEKNKLIYELISKSFDYCMINSKCAKSSIDFSKFVFYLDTNILFRLMGLNNDTRKNSVSVFINKCLSEKIEIKISSFVAEECRETIEQNINMLIERTHVMTALISPSSMSFAEENSFGSDFYKIYYEWCKNGNKHRNYDGFRKYIFQVFKQATKDFVIDTNQLSFSVVNPDIFNQLFDSLYEIKEDKYTVATDVNSILLTKSNREKELLSDTYFISADKTLITWASEIFKSYRKIVDYPSAWLSILLKFTGREKVDDYKSFCQFIHLPVSPEPEPDLRKKIDIKTSILLSDFDDRIKDEMIQEIKKDYNNYRDADTEEIIYRAYAKTEKLIKQQAEQVAEENSKDKYEKLLQIEKEQNKAELNEMKEAMTKQNDIEKKEQYKQGVLNGQESIIRKIAERKCRNRKRLKKILGVIICIAGILFTISFIFALIKIVFQISTEWLDTVSRVADVVTIISAIIALLAYGIRYAFNEKTELLEDDEEKVYQRIKKKLEKTSNN